MSTLNNSTTSLTSSTSSVSRSQTSLDSTTSSGSASTSSTYWTVSHGKANRTGFSCRECKKVIIKDTPISVRDGRKMRFFYHRECFSEDSDPRTQSNSSKDRFGEVIGDKAPDVKGRGKWSVGVYGYQGR
ncbi:hypothetical protein HDU97_003703 [Phlyctochytrium planicorne]|nr:hypothetical protein HDU97_003703 [Phlyctochytrium planicorne]